MLSNITTDSGFFDEDLALGKLLIEGILFSNHRFYSLEKDGKSSGYTTVLFVLCNDVFAWGCADAEDLPFNEIENLYNMVLSNSKWGAIRWVCIKRNMQPQLPIIEDMKKEGVWDETMSNLGANPYNELIKDKLKE